MRQEIAKSCERCGELFVCNDVGARVCPECKCRVVCRNCEATGPRPRDLPAHVPAVYCKKCQGALGVTVDGRALASVGRADFGGTSGDPIENTERVKEALGDQRARVREDKSGEVL